MKIIRISAAAFAFGLALVAAAQAPNVAYVESIPNPRHTGPILPPTAIYPNSKADAGHLPEPGGSDWPAPGWRKHFDPAQNPKLAGWIAQAKNGDLKTQRLLINAYLGNGISSIGPHDEVQGSYWLQQELDNPNLDARGHQLVGVAYGFQLLTGRGVIMDQQRAAESILPVADEIFTAADPRNGRTILLVDRPGEDYAALMYMMGWGVGVDYQAAQDWLNKSMPHTRIWPDGDYCIGNGFGCVLKGVLYLEGWGVEQDLTRAFKLFDQAARNNNTDGMVKLGEMLMYGIGTDIDYQQAMDNFNRACSYGNSMGCYGVGELFGRGWTVDRKKNLHRAYLMYLLSAREGFPRGMGQVTDHLFRGLGVKKDLALAYHWAQKGAGHGCSLCERELPEIAAQLGTKPAAP